MSTRQNRRQFMGTAALAGATMPYWFTSSQPIAHGFQSANERPLIGSIGTGDRWKQVIGGAMNFGDVVACCDVDANHVEEGKKICTDAQTKKGVNRSIDTYDDYRKILDRKDIDIVTIVTPDHWHSKIAIEAMQAGKDIYCEKPLTLTINEGKQIVKVLNETKRVFQVGTQQRSEMGQRFIQAVALIREGRIGKLLKATCDIGGAPTCGEIPKADVPKGLNWEKWLGQAPLVDFRFKEGGRWGNSRCHYEFRWWYEYSGGKMTDWGAHHVDIASWAIGQDGPIKVIPVEHHHPVEFKNGMPVQDDRYNAADKFHVQANFAEGIEMHIVSNSKDGNGILFEGTEGRFHVSRGAIKGGPIEALKDKPLPDGAIEKVYGGKKPESHMKNFMECVKTREKPISDVWSHHRAMTTCHLANIAIRLDKTLEWDPKTEQITNDKALNVWQGREQRKGYEINVSL